MLEAVVTYASPAELMGHPELQNLLYQPEQLEWFSDRRNPKGELTAFSAVPGIAFGISFRTDPCENPWCLRIHHPQLPESTVYPTLAEALGYADVHEEQFTTMYGPTPH